jgi:hypothetical protein
MNFFHTFFTFPGIKPLPESYAAVTHAFAQKGDLVMAESVYASASHQLAGDSFKSWATLTTALFDSGNTEQAAAILEQARVAERLVPFNDPKYREAKAECFYSLSCLHLLFQGKDQGFIPDANIFKAMIMGSCHCNNVVAAIGHLLEMLVRHSLFIVKKYLPTQ